MAHPVPVSRVWVKEWSSGWSEVDIALFGRDLELNAGRAFLATAPARGLLVEGPAGIGKTAVWRALLDIARTDGYLVLETIGDAAEARLTFAGLADLLETVADEALPRLPAPQARALEVALLRADAVSPAEPRAVAAGLLGALRALAGTRPVLVAIDDVQWLDEASADAVAFAARRGRQEAVRLARAPRAAPGACRRWRRRAARPPSGTRQPRSRRPSRGEPRRGRRTRLRARRPPGGGRAGRARHPADAGRIAGTARTAARAGVVPGDGRRTGPPEGTAYRQPRLDPGRFTAGPCLAAAGRGLLRAPRRLPAGP